MDYSAFSEYQKKAITYAIYPKTDPKYLYPLIGLAGESGEVFEKMKKIIRDKGGKISKEDRKELAKELGDILWYLSVLSHELKIDFSEVPKMNIEKLESRKQRNKIHGDGDNR